jgi:hypothetical protein
MVLGGAKVSDKLGLIENLLPKVDQILIGGGMCFTFLKARGESVGASVIQEDMLESAAGLLDGEYGDKIILPLDVVASTSFTKSGANRIVDVHSLTEHEIGLDIGPSTYNLFADTIRRSKTIFWNGPMGVFEWPRFAAGKGPNGSPVRWQRRTGTQGWVVAIPRPLSACSATRIRSIISPPAGERASSCSRGEPSPGLRSWRDGHGNQSD